MAQYGGACSTTPLQLKETPRHGPGPIGSSSAFRVPCTTTSRPGLQLSGPHSRLHHNTQARTGLRPCPRSLLPPCGCPAACPQGPTCGCVSPRFSRPSESGPSPSPEPCCSSADTTLPIAAPYLVQRCREPRAQACRGQAIWRVARTIWRAHGVPQLEARTCALASLCPLRAPRTCPCPPCLFLCLLLSICSVRSPSSSAQASGSAASRIHGGETGRFARGQQGKASKPCSQALTASPSHHSWRRSCSVSHISTRTASGANPAAGAAAAAGERFLPLLRPLPPPLGPAWSAGCCADATAGIGAALAPRVGPRLAAPPAAELAG